MALICCFDLWWKGIYFIGHPGAVFGHFVNVIEKWKVCQLLLAILSNCVTALLLQFFTILQVSNQQNCDMSRYTPCKGFVLNKLYCFIVYTFYVNKICFK